MLATVYLSLCSAALPVATQSFEPEAFAATPTNTHVRFADMNGDGFHDLLFREFDRVAWTANDGNGAFLKRQFATPMPTDVALTHFAGGDLDGDGDADLLTVYMDGPGINTSELGWFEGLGEGAFGAFQPITLLEAFSPAKGLRPPVDLDADGDLDILVLNRVEKPSWVENLGGGSFAALRELGSTTFGNRYFDAHDLDGDGLLDVTWADSSLAYWRRNLGGGQFGAATQVFLALDDIASMAVADWDGDGAMDLFFSDTFSGGLNLYWRRNEGAGIFAARAPLVPGVWFNQLAVGDFNGDGFTDVAGGYFPHTLQLFRNAGNGQVLAPVNLLPGWSGLGSGELVGEDIDHDGDLDLVASDGSSDGAIRCYENVGAALPAVGRNIDREVSGVPVDFDLDGDVDLVGASRLRRDVILIENESGGQFSLAAPLITDLRGVVGVDATDLDGDGRLELLVGTSNAVSGWPTGTRVRIFRPTQGGYDAGTQILPVEAVSMAPRVDWVDMDSDGDADALVTFTNLASNDDLSIGWSRNDGAAGFTPRPPVPFPSLREILEVVDLDRDGLLDVVGLEESTGDLVWYRGLTVETYASASGLGVTVPVAIQVDLADVDGDSDLDLLHLDSASNEARVCFQIAPGSFSAPQTVLALPIPGYSIGAVDWDLDGDWDPIVSASDAPNQWFSQLLLIESTGAGTFGSVTTLESDSPPGRLWVADLDGDRDLDLWKTSSGSFSFLLNQERIGEAYCGAGEPNSTGVSSKISAVGSPVVALNDVTLLASDLPVNSFGYFLVGDEANSFVLAGGSQGTLCVGGEIGRFNRGPGEIFQAGAAGEVSVAIDLSDIPTPAGSVVIFPGETRFFQAWYRDANPSVTSNFTTALAIRFR